MKHKKRFKEKGGMKEPMNPEICVIQSTSDKTSKNWSDETSLARLDRRTCYKICKTTYEPGNMFATAYNRQNLKNCAKGWKCVDDDKKRVCLRNADLLELETAKIDTSTNSESTERGVTRASAQVRWLKHYLSEKKVRMGSGILDPRSRAKEASQRLRILDVPNGLAQFHSIAR